MADANPATQPAVVDESVQHVDEEGHLELGGASQPEPSAELGPGGEGLQVKQHLTCPTRCLAGGRDGHACRIELEPGPCRHSDEVMPVAIILTGVCLQLGC